MSLSRTSVFAAESTAVGAYTTSSFTPPANSLLVVSGWMLSDTDIRAGLSVSGGGLTFTQRGPTLNPDANQAAPGFTDVQQMWTAPIGASPSSMTVTITPPATNTFQVLDLHIVAYSGYDTITPIGATGSFGGTGAIASGLSESLTLSGAPASTSFVFASMAAGANNAAGPITQGAGWTEIYDWVGADVNGLGFQSQERTGSTSTTVTWANTDTNGNAGGLYGCSGLAIEIRVASGTAVTANSGVPFEFISNLRQDGLALLEWLTSVRADRPLQLEAIAAVRRDNTDMLEIVAGLSANTAAQLEFLGSARRDNLGALESASALRSDVIVLMETLAGQRSDMIAATEILASLRADLVMPIENQGTIGVTGNGAVQIETTSAFKSDAAIPFEMGSSFRADTVAPLESTANRSAQSGVTIENTLGLQGNSAVQTETQGGVIVTGSAVLQLETTGSVVTQAGVLVENFLAVSFALSGMTINSVGVFIPFVTVLLFRTSDNVFIASTTSDAGGNYSFAGLPNNTTDYFVNGYLTGAPDLFGTTSDKLTPS